VKITTAQSSCSHHWTSHTVSCSCRQTRQLFLVLQTYSNTERWVHEGTSVDAT